MNASNKITLDDIRQMNLVDYLTRLGFKEDDIDGNDYWYHSPLHVDKTPSFKVDNSKNIWIDFGGESGAGREVRQASHKRKVGSFNGGNIIDFALQYHGWTVQQLLDDFNGMTVGSLPVKHGAGNGTNEPREPKIKILSERKLFSYPLLNYIKERRISQDMADRYCREVSYEIKGRSYYAIGFKNDHGGFELRSRAIKLSSSPKGITTIDNGSNKVVTVEGYFNLLSWLTLYREQEKLFNFTVLNSLSFFESARPFMEKHQSNFLYLDQGNSGQNYTKYALSLNPLYVDKSSLYAGYDDLNDWHIRFGHARKTHKSQRL